MANSKPINAVAWKSYSKQLVKSTIEDLVHFSAKVVNSNAAPAGVRLSQEQRLDLSYVAVLTIGPDAVPLDYIKNAGPVAKIAKTFEAVRESRVQEVFIAAPADEVAYYAECQISTRFYHEVGVNSIGKRMRQIIVQTADGQDIALTPMASAGLGALLAKKLKREQKEAGDAMHTSFNPRPHGLLRVGGANPQNVGQHVRTLQRPLWFSPPQVDQNFRKAYALHFKGINLDAPLEILANYYRRRRCHQRRPEILPVTAPRDLAANHWLMQRYIETIKERTEEARNLLDYYRDSLPEQQLLDKSVPAEVCALISPQKQYSGWRRQLAIRLCSIIFEKTVDDGSGCEGNDSMRVECARMLLEIEEALE